MQDIYPLSGWSLSYVVALDSFRAGTAGEFLRASAERRQIIAALLATKPFPSGSSDAAELAELISRGTHREILSEAFGTVPRGLRGALARSGHQPHPRTFYPSLFQLLSSPEKSRVASVVRQLDSLDLMRLRIAQRLPERFCMANLIIIIGDVRTAADVAQILQLFIKGGIDPDALAGALSRVSTASQLSNLWDRWSQKLPFPISPLARSDRYIPVDSGAALRQLALRYSNCAQRYLPQALEGESAFGEFICGVKRAVIHLKKDEGLWSLHGLFDVENEPVEQGLRSAALSFLADSGIRTKPRQHKRGGEWSVLRRLSSAHMFEF